MTKNPGFGNDAELAAWTRRQSLAILGFLQIAGAQCAAQRAYGEMERCAQLATELRSQVGPGALSEALARAAVPSA